MITAKIARYVSERCNEYMEKLKNYKYDVEELIMERTSAGRTTASFEVKESDDRYSISHDLKKILLENNYHVHEKISPDKIILDISW